MEKTKEQLIKELEPQAKKLADRTAGACQNLIEALADWQEFVAEHKQCFGLFEFPAKLQIPEPLRGLAARPNSKNNLLQLAIATRDKYWGKV